MCYIGLCACVIQYCEFYETHIPLDITKSTWERCLDRDNPSMRCFVADLPNNKVEGCVGFAIVVLHPTSFSQSQVLYLEDLFVSPDGAHIEYSFWNKCNIAVIALCSFIHVRLLYSHLQPSTRSSVATTQNRLHFVTAVQSASSVESRSRNRCAVVMYFDSWMLRHLIACMSEPIL